MLDLVLITIKTVNYLELVVMSQVQPPFRSTQILYAHKSYQHKYAETQACCIAMRVKTNPQEYVCVVCIVLQCNYWLVHYVQQNSNTLG